MSDAPLRLSGLQLDVMRVLWAADEATAADVHAALAPARGLAPTTVSTLLARLEKRGVVEHRSEGRQFVYRATVSEAQVRRSMVSELAEQLFGGDPAALVSHLVRERELDAGDLARVQRLLDDAAHPAAAEPRRTDTDTDTDTEHPADRD